MKSENEILQTKLSVVFDALLMLLSAVLGYYIRFYAFSGMAAVTFPTYMYTGLAVLAVEFFLYDLLGLYRLNWHGAVRNELSAIFAANTIAFALLVTALYVLKSINFSRGALLMFYLLENIFLAARRIIQRRSERRSHSRGRGLRQVILIGGGDLADMCAANITGNPALGYSVLGYVADRSELEDYRHLGTMAELESVLAKHNCAEVVIALDADEYDFLPQTVFVCEKYGAQVSVIPLYAKYLPVKMHLDQFNGLPMLNVRKMPLGIMTNAFAKRFIDILGSLVLIVLLSPIMLATAVGVRLSSPGPIIFKQQRVGYKKVNFYMYKFRSMRVNDSEDTAWTTNEDDRKTAFGSFIRKYSIDELPQLFNVLKGDMSLVGPRPELPHFVEEFSKTIPLYVLKHQVRPGMTGWAQVNGYRGDTSIRKRIEHDLYYIENWSLIFDFQILLMTITKVKNNEVVTLGKKSGAREKTGEEKGD